MFNIFEQTCESMLAAKTQECHDKYNKRVERDSTRERTAYDPEEAYWHRRKHAAHYAHHAALRRARTKQATPIWADLKRIKRLYATCPEGSHVDHTIPLTHPLVCGLHCEANLQHLTAEENINKSNFFIV